jgi:hypothetical protein
VGLAIYVPERFPTNSCQLKGRGAPSGAGSFSAGGSPKLLEDRGYFTDTTNNFNFEDVTSLRESWARKLQLNHLRHSFFDGAFLEQCRTIFTLLSDGVDGNSDWLNARMEYRPLRVQAPDQPPAAK